MDTGPAHQPTRDTREVTRTRTGQMTAVMRAMSVALGPKVLRVGVVRGGRVIEERVIKQRITVTVGSSEAAMFVVPSLTITPVFRLFERIGDGYRLNVKSGMTGRVALSGGITSLEGAHGRPIELDEGARGKVVIGDTTLLFQFVAPPAEPSRPHLPLAVKAGLRNDWTLTFIAAVSFLVHFGLVGTMYSDWSDPIVGDRYDVKGIVDLMVKIPTPPPIEVPADSAALTTPTSAPTNAPANAPTASRTSSTERTKTRPADTQHTDRSPGRTAPLDEGRTAMLAARAEQMQIQILVGLEGGPAVKGAVDRSNVPPVDLAQVAERNVGAVRGNDELKVASGGPIGARKSPGLTALGTTKTDGVGTIAGKETTVAGPTGVANIGAPSASSPIPNADGVVAGLRGRFRSCYQKGLDLDSTMSGKVVISAKVGPNGEVSSADIASISGLSPAVGQCIAGVVKRAVFGAPGGGGGASVQIPVTFVQAR